MRYYTGIGSRTTPPDIQALMTQIATRLELDGFTLRSGGAPGADKAFERGVRDPENKQILMPGDASPEAEEIASRIHPAWDRCNEYARNCHGRNVMQLLGQTLQAPSEFVIAWTPGGEDIGGSRTVLVLARQYKIPTYNLAHAEDERLLMELLGI